MSQSITHACTHCNAPVPDTMGFCPNCGTPINASNGNAAGYAPAQTALPPPNTVYAQQAPPVYQPAPHQQYQPLLQSSQPPPAYARPQKNSSRGILKVGLILLILLILLGAGGFFAFRYVSSRAGNRANTDANSEATPTQAPLKTTPINTTIIYASDTITILNAQQATSFADDTSMPAQGVVRLNLHAVQSDVNKGFTNAPVFSYPECFTLLLPGGNKVSMGGYKDLTGPAQKEDRTTWIDFPASTSLKVNQMVLQMGKDTEEQLQVPLTGHADLSQYQPKQSNPDLRVQFGSVFWTLKTVTLKLSDSGTQVDKGQRFLLLAFSLDNPSTEGDNSFPGDYIRLQYGSTTITPDQAIIGSVGAGTTNVPGLVSFLVPQDTTTATFLLLPGHTPGATNQATIPFQIP